MTCVDDVAHCRRKGRPRFETAAFFIFIFHVCVNSLCYFSSLYPTAVGQLLALVLAGLRGQTGAHALALVMVAPHINCDAVILQRAAKEKPFVTRYATCRYTHLLFPYYTGCAVLTA